MNRNHDETRPEISDWKCERFLLNELEEAEMQEMRDALEVDGHLRMRLEALARSNREILEAYPVDRMRSRIEARLARPAASATKLDRSARGRWLRMALAPAGLIVVLAIATMVLPDFFGLTGGIDTEVTRIKGAAAELRVYRKTGTASERLADGARVAPHDLILLQYEVQDEAYGAILSVDGRGRITTHLPAEGMRSAALTARQPTSLDFAYELDDAPRFEVFFFVTSSSPFPVSRVSRAIEGALSSPRDDLPDRRVELSPALDLPEDYRVSKFTLVKEAGHEN